MRSISSPWTWITLGVAALVVHPALAVLPDNLKNKELKDCVEGRKWDKEPDMSFFWSDSGAEQFADEYIDANKGSSNWTQNLYMELFPNAKHTDMACITTGSSCTFVEKCEDFNAIKKGGLYYLFVSMINFHAYMAELKSRFNEDTFLAAMDIDQIHTDLKFSGDSKSTQTRVAIINAFAGAASMGSGLTAAFPPIAAGLAVLAGIFVILGAIPYEEKKDMITDNSVAEMEKLIELISEVTLQAIDKLVGAVFGLEGQADDIIPDNMRPGKDVKNPAAQVWGFGGWLKDQPNINMDQWAKQTEVHLEQAIWWQMARIFKGIFVVIRNDLNTKDKCSGAEKGWDEKETTCYSMMNWNGNKPGTSGYYFGGANELKNIFADRNMDQVKVMKNAADCWKASNGDIGTTANEKTKPHTELFKHDDYPPCFFATTVIKGGFRSRRAGMEYTHVNLDKGWPKQEKGGYFPM
ncbi:hypothetical protein B0H66DRAFT_607663 [Apodospora peruviana]|uniref:Uncharacterized protein n=1 Tax=Apodospora peruviana TaxID=516989 RepID=A0AAE0HTG2_9PEZI|nr:hypothetical protein B0H66DRAFT_607663 [Apodospora peruviana]